MRIAFATWAEMPDGWEDDRESARLLGADFRVWDDPQVDWESYDRVVIRSTWDYTARVEEFVGWCERVGRERLRNSPELVAFNVDKRYLLALDAPVVETLLVEPGHAPPPLAGEVVVKPNVSAGARDTGRFGPAAHAQARALIERITASGRTALVQPYLRAVDELGETAFVFFGGELSHVLHKRAVLAPDEVAPVAPGPVGAALVMYEEDLVTPAEADGLRRGFAQEVIEEISRRFGTPLYARVDVVLDDGRPRLLELEAVEPALFMALAPGSAERFAAAVRAS